MTRPPRDGQALLVGCTLCERLHEPRSALDLNPICAVCSEKLSGNPPIGPDRRPPPDGESP